MLSGCSPSLGFSPQWACLEPSRWGSWVNQGSLKFCRIGDHRGQDSSCLGPRSCSYIVELLSPRVIIRYSPHAPQKRPRATEPGGQGWWHPWVPAIEAHGIPHSGWNPNCPHPGVPSVAGLENASAERSVGTSAREARRRGEPALACATCRAPHGVQTGQPRLPGLSGDSRNGDLKNTISQVFNLATN